MSTISITVKSRLVGSGTYGPPPCPVEVELAEGAAITIRELITLTVKAQVEAMAVQTELDPEEVRASFERQYGRLPGDSPSSQSGRDAAADPTDKVPVNIDVGVETENAIRAFDSGRMALLANGKQIEGLDTELTLPSGSKVTFLRMIQVAGG